MAIENRALEPGTRLAARYKGELHTLEVVETEGGLRYRLADGREFKSPSAAGSAVMGGSACNGWRFWSLEGTESPARERKPKEPKAPKQPRATRTRAPRTAKPKKNGAGTHINDGLDGWVCDTCGAELPSGAAATEHVAQEHPTEPEMAETTTA